MIQHIRKVALRTRFLPKLKYYKTNLEGVYIMLEDARKEAKREFDMKYIRILLHHGLSIEEIAKEAKLDKLYVEEIKSEIDSKKKSN